MTLGLISRAIRTYNTILQPKRRREKKDEINKKTEISYIKNCFGPILAEVVKASCSTPQIPGSGRRSRHWGRIWGRSLSGTSPMLWINNRTCSDALSAFTSVSVHVLFVFLWTPFIWVNSSKDADLVMSESK